jgi:hypothetical protein
MNREEIVKQFKVVSGFIRSSGKFLGCPQFVPHYWHLAERGMADREEVKLKCMVYIFFIDSSDVEMWPELARTNLIKVWQLNGRIYYSEEPRGS